MNKLFVGLLLLVGSLNAQSIRYYASQIAGVVLDANLDGANTQSCTNNTAALNTVLATATALHPVDLVMDGPSCLYNILQPSSARGISDIMCLDLRNLANVTIEGQGVNAGFIVKDGEHCAGISNLSVYPAPGETPTRTMGNYVFKNFRLVGALDVGSSTVANGFKIFHANNVLMENITIQNVNYAFGTVWGNVGNVVIKDNSILQPPTSGTDPLHFNGPFDHITIENNKLQSGDDCIALNLPERPGGVGSYVTMTNNTMVGSGCSNFMRIYNSSTSGFYWGSDHIVVDGVYGKANCNSNGYIFYFGEAGYSGAPTLNNLHASHIDVDASGNCGLAWFRGTWGEAYISDWVLKNPKPNTASILLTGDATSFTFKNGVIKRTASNQSSAWPVQITDYVTTVSKMDIANITVLDAVGSFINSPQLIDIPSGNLGTLNVGTPLNRNGKITNLFSSGSVARVSTVNGASNFNYPNTQNVGSNTQAIITYTCTVPGTVLVSQTAFYIAGVLGSPVNDTNETLFPGSSAGDRVGSGVSPTNANVHYFVAGTRITQQGSNGNNYSRALPANSTLYYQINCNGTVLPGANQSYTLSTSNLPTNETFSEPVQIDSGGLPVVPTVPDARGFNFIDPKTGVSITNMYTTADGPHTPYLYSGGSVPMCSAQLTGPGPGWLCGFPADGGGFAMLYYIIPSTNTINYLGYLQITSNDPAYWPACGSGGFVNAQMDDLIPTNVYGTVDYLTGGSCSGTPIVQSVAIKGTYVGDYQAVVGNPIVNMSWSLLTPSSKYLAGLIHDFNSDFDATKFHSCGFAVIGQYAYVPCQRSSQGSYAWYAVMDMGDKLPLGACTNCMHIIGAIKYDNSVNRWTGTHNGSLTPLGSSLALIIPGYEEGCSYDTSTRPCDPTSYPQIGMGPYAMKLVGDITTSTTSITVASQPTSLSDYVVEPTLMNAQVGDQAYLCPGTTLAASITSTSQTTVTVTNGAQFQNGDRVFIGANPTETFTILTGGGTNTWLISRGTNGSAPSTYTNGTGVAKWYNDCRTNEVVTLSTVSSFPNLTVSRAFFNSVSAWASGSNLVMNGQRNTDAGVHSLWWDFLNATNGEAVGFRYELNPDFTNVHNDWAAKRWAAEEYHVRSGSLEARINGSTDIQVDPSVAFNGVAAIGYGNSYTRYPSVEKPNASNIEQQWFLDYPHFEGGDPFSANPGVSQVSGQLYKYIFCTVASSNCGGSESLLHRKQHPTWVRAGKHLLRDLSGPLSTIPSDNSQPWTYCIVNKVDECVTGSVVGEAYANVPGLTVNHCASKEHPDDSSIDLCMVDMTFSGSGVKQFSMIPSTNGYGRGLTSMLALIGSPDQALAKSTPDGGFTFFRTRPDKMFIATNPPFKFIPDEYDRTTFIPVPVSVPPAGLSLPATTATATVEFGYAEYSNNCTTRNDPCLAIAGSIISPPFFFKSETPSKLGCASGCTIVVPALSNRTLYASIKYYSSGGALLRTDTLPPIIVAPAGFDGSGVIPNSTCNIVPTILPNGTIGTSYSQTLNGVSCNTGVSLVWSVTSGSLPSGLTLNTSTGVISGIPTVVSNYSFNLHVASGISSADAFYNLSINPGSIIPKSPSQISGKITLSGKVSH